MNVIMILLVNGVCDGVGDGVDDVNDYIDIFNQ